MIRALALVCAVVLLVGLGAPPRVSFIRPPGFVNEYAALRFVVQVDPHAENAALVVAALDGSLEWSTLEDAVRLTREQLDGEAAPRTRWIEWREGLPAGEYLLVAVLYSGIANESALASVTNRVTVLGR